MKVSSTWPAGCKVHGCHRTAVTGHHHHTRQRETNAKFGVNRRKRYLIHKGHFLFMSRIHTNEPGLKYSMVFASCYVRIIRVPEGGPMTDAVNIVCLCVITLITCYYTMPENFRETSVEHLYGCAIHTHTHTHTSQWRVGTPTYTTMVIQWLHNGCPNGKWQMVWHCSKQQYRTPVVMQWQKYYYNGTCLRQPPVSQL